MKHELNISIFMNFTSRYRSKYFFFYYGIISNIQLIITNKKYIVFHSNLTFFNMRLIKSK